MLLEAYSGLARRANLSKCFWVTGYIWICPHGGVVSVSQDNLTGTQIEKFEELG